ncbi:MULTISPECIES: hypothetical protein [unclassified Sinorhizobium]|uniref:hypothetical protein n=1 Tax=unclassified Sinorhizobium TaxID=2613772 RepID=UPI00352503B1
MRDILTHTPEAAERPIRTGKPRDHIKAAGINPAQPGPSSRPHLRYRNRQMRERRTAYALMIFGIVLACVEIFIIFRVL